MDCPKLLNGDQVLLLWDHPTWLTQLPLLQIPQDRPLCIIGSSTLIKAWYHPRALLHADQV